MDYAKLQAALLSPTPLNYVGLSDQAASDQMNSVTTGLTRPRTAVPIQEVFNAINDAAWPQTAILQDKLRAILSMSYVDASNSNTRGIFGAIFPNSGATLATNTRLNALGSETVSHAALIGIEPPTAYQVGLARSGKW